MHNMSDLEMLRELRNVFGLPHASRATLLERIREARHTQRQYFETVIRGDGTPLLPSVNQFLQPAVGQ